MRTRQHLLLLSLSAVLAAAWIGAGRPGEKTGDGRWTEIAPGILRTPGMPAGGPAYDQFLH